MNDFPPIGPRFPLTLAESTDRGRCLMTLADIPQGATIETAPVQVLPTELARYIDSYRLDFFVSWDPPDVDKTLALPLGLFGLCNHSDSPNAMLSIDYSRRLVYLLALTTITINSEITIAYKDASGSYSSAGHK